MKGRKILLLGPYGPHLYGGSDKTLLEYMMEYPPAGYSYVPFSRSTSEIELLFHPESKYARVLHSLRIPVDITLKLLDLCDVDLIHDHVYSFMFRTKDMRKKIPIILSSGVSGMAFDSEFLAKMLEGPRCISEPVGWFLGHLM